MGLNMRGQVSGPFVTHKGVQLNRYASEYIDFESVLTLVKSDKFDANIQPVGDKEIEFFNIGGERINDYRVLHPRGAPIIELAEPGKLSDIIVFSELPGKPVSWWKAVDSDMRPWHGFSRAVIVRLDPSEVERIGLDALLESLEPAAAELYRYANVTLPRDVADA